jgi:hypothetical protein
MRRKHEIGVAVSDTERAVRLSPVHWYTVNRNGSDPSQPPYALRDEPSFKKLE